jgi:hypothetical protein
MGTARFASVSRVVACAAFALGVTGCTTCSKGGGGAVAGPLDRAALGAMAKVDGVDFAPYLATAHAIVTHAARPATTPPPGPGDRVFITAWTRGKQPLRATGLGATLIDSVVAASEELAKMTNEAGETRIEIDALTSAEPAVLDPKLRDRVFDIGLHGYVASDAAGKIGWVLPSEVILDGDVDLGNERKETLQLRGEKLIDSVIARAHSDAASVAKMNVARIMVDSRIEPAVAGEPPIALFRTMPPHPTTLTPDALLAAVRAGADYLARVVDDQGVFTYLYDPVRDQKERGYGMLRHAGAIYALMEAYDELRVIEWQKKASLAIMHLKSVLKQSADGMYLTDNLDEEQQKVGGNGLALIAMVKYAQATGDLSDLPTMRELARFTVHQQYGDGHFRENADVMREDEAARAKKLKKEVSYFAGEATLGLVRLYAIDPDPRWLAAARKSGDYLVQVRDVHDDLKHQIHDHWLSYALHDLYVLTKEPSYAKHAQKIADAIYLGERTPETAPWPDYVGAFYDQGETTPTSTRLEALASTFQLDRFMGTDETKIREVSMQLACFMRGQQLDAESLYFIKDPARSVGGVRESLLNSDIRIDYPQHAMSAWLRLARLLRDPEWGKPGK